MILITYLVILFICLVTGLVLRTSLSQALTYVLWLIIVTIPVEAVGYYNLMQGKKPPGWWFPCYQILEYALIGGYFTSLSLLRKFRQIILLSIPPVVMLNVIYLLNRQGYGVLATYSFLLAAFLITFWSVAYFYQLFNDTELQNPAHNPNFWVCTGLLFFYAGTFFQMGLTNIIYEQNRELAEKLYVINHLLNCILYGMITYGFICQSRYRN